MITRQHIEAAFILLGIPLARVGDVVSLRVAEGKVEANLIYHDENDMMVITKHGAVLELWKDEVK